MSDQPHRNGLDTTPPEQSEGAEFDLRHYLDLFRRKWWIILGAGCVATAWVAWSQRHVVPVPMYSAEALVQRVPSGAGRAMELGMATRPVDIASELRILRTRQVLGQVVDELGLRLRVPDRPEIQGRLFSEVEISPQAARRDYELRLQDERLRLLAAGQEVATSSVREALVGPGFQLTVADPGLIPPAGLRITVVSHREAIAALDGSLGVAPVDNTSLIRITFSGRDPVLVADVANTVATAYQRQAAQKRQEEARRTREFIEARLATVTDSLDAARDMFLDFQAASQSFNPRAEAEGVQDQLTSAVEERRRLQETERSLTELIVSLQTRQSDALRQMRLFTPDLVPAASQLFQRLQNYEEQRNQLVNVRRRTANSPEVELLDSLMVETAGEIRVLAEETLNMTAQQIDRQDARIAELRRRMGSAPQANWEYGRLEQRVEAVQRTHDMLTTQLHEAQIAEAVQSSDVEIVDPAVVPTNPAWIGGGKRSLPLAFLMGALGGAALALILDRLDTRVRRPDEIRKHARSEIIGTIPTLRTARAEGRPLVAHNGVVSSEAFRMLRTNLRFVRTDTLRSIAITSAGPQEGKSVITSNLALAMAQEGKRILLVDADLRRPVVHGIFGVERLPGLSDILVGEPTREAIHKAADYGIDIIPAGTSVPNPAELVGSVAFRNFLEKAKENYDVVLVDTPPVLAVTDASVVAAAVDGVVLVVRQDRTHRTALANAGDQLRRARASLLGVVVNGIDEGKRYGHYGGRYGYGYGYGATEYLKKDQGEKKEGRRRIPFFG